MLTLLAFFLQSILVASFTRIDLIRSETAFKLNNRTNLTNVVLRCDKGGPSNFGCYISDISYSISALSENFTSDVNFALDLNSPSSWILEERAQICSSKSTCKKYENKDSHRFSCSSDACKRSTVQGKAVIAAYGLKLEGGLSKTNIMIESVKGEMTKIDSMPINVVSKIIPINATSNPNPTLKTGGILSLCQSIFTESKVSFYVRADDGYSLNNSLIIDGWLPELLESNNIANKDSKPEPKWIPLLENKKKAADPCSGYLLKMKSLSLAINNNNTQNTTTDENKKKQHSPRLDLSLTNLKGKLALDTSFIGLPLSLAKKLINFLNNDENKKYNSKCQIVEGNVGLVRCRKLKFPRHFRLMHFNFELGDQDSSFQGRIESSTMMRDCKLLDDSSYDCFLNINVLKDEEEIILGEIFFKDFLLIFDSKNRQLGIGQAKKEEDISSHENHSAKRSATSTILLFSFIFILAMVPLGALIINKWKRIKKILRRKFIWRNPNEKYDDDQIEVAEYGSDKNRKGEGVEIFYTTRK